MDEEDDRLYLRHRWRSEGFHGEAKTWRGLARTGTVCAARALEHAHPALLTAAATNLKRLATALLDLIRALSGLRTRIRLV